MQFTSYQKGLCKITCFKQLKSFLLFIASFFLLHFFLLCFVVLIEKISDLNTTTNIKKKKCDRKKGNIKIDLYKTILYMERGIKVIKRVFLGHPDPYPDPDPYLT